MSDKKIKVLFLTKYPVAGASSRYRVYQYLPYFEHLEFKTQSLLSEKAFELLYKRGGTIQKIAVSISDYIRRLLFLFRNLDAKVIYMQRELFAYGPIWVEQLLKLFGKKLIFDMDDALFINKQNKSTPFQWNKAARVKQIIRITDLVVAGNAWIRDESIKFGAESAVHVDVAEEIQLRKTSHRSSKSSLTVIWLGSPTTSKYLKLIETALLQVQQSIGLSIYIVGGDPNLDLAFKAKNIEWSSENEKHYLSISDVGLMPLPNENWSKGKCGGKARTYMASGVVPIVTNIGYNRQLIKNRERGFLCNNSEDWYDAMLELHNYPSLIEKIRQTNYGYVEKYFDRRKIATTLEKIILDQVKSK